MKTIAFIGTGGTISAIGEDRFDLLDYTATDRRLSAQDLLAQTELDGDLARIEAVEFRSFDSTAITQADWAALAALCVELAEAGRHDGIVIAHGTASLEETAFLLDCVLDLKIPVVLTGAMRPSNGISGDGAANIAAAVRVAMTPETVAHGVVVTLHDEIHAARDVTKTDTLRLDTFKSPALGPLGYVHGDMVRFERHAPQRAAELRFDHALIAAMPRVDICYSYVGADATVIDAFCAAGAKGIVSAGFGPGMASPTELEALTRAVSGGTVVVQSSRCASGPVVNSKDHRDRGIISGRGLSPQKARILLALCLARGCDMTAIDGCFAAV